MEGLNNVLDNLNKEIAGIKGRSVAGLWEAGLKVQASSQKRLKDSVVTGNLRASAYTRAADDFKRIDPQNLEADKNDAVPSDRLVRRVEIGFTAVYAVFAHENMEGRAPKFLEDAVTENRGNIIKILQRTAKV